MGAYRDGGHMYHATMPTDAIKIFRDVVPTTASARVGSMAWRLISE